MPTRRTTDSHAPARNDVQQAAEELEKGSDALYRDRPTDDGMKGDGGEEPNAGAPHMPKQTPSRRAHQTRKKSRTN